MQTALKREYILDNLCCPKCAAKIEKHIGSLQGVNQALVDFSVQKLIIEAQNAGLWDDIMTRTGEIIKRLEPSIELRDAVPFPNREAVKGKEPVPAKKWIRRLSLILGFRFAGESSDLSNLNAIITGIHNTFTISPILLIPPIVVIVTIALKMPAIPGIFPGIVTGGVLGTIVQGNSFGDLLSCAYSGFVSETGVEAIDELLTSGGLENMMYSISLTILAMMFGGIMESTGQLEVIVNQLIKIARGTVSLVTLTILTCIGSNACMPEQYISIVVPGRMYNASYRKRGLHPKMLSNALESAGTITSALIPWNTCGVYMSGVLGIATIHYMPWAFFNYLMPLAVIIMTAAGLLTVKISDDPDTVIAVEEEN